MPIKFFNVRSGETKVCDTEPLISAYFNSSDLSPNAHAGQDFGWRLAPEIVVRIKQIRSNPNQIEKIAVRYSLPLDEVKDTDILRFISAEEFAKERAKNEGKDHTDEYEAEIRSLEDKKKSPAKSNDNNKEEKTDGTTKEK